MITALWPHWFRPQWLLILPLLVLLIWRLWHRQKRAGRWQMLLPTHFHAVLLNGGRGSNSKLPWLALGLAWLLALFALLGPSWQRVEQISQKPVDPLVVILELTPQMLATDTPPTRLEQARRKLLDLLQKRSDAQTAIVVYAGSAHTLVPLSDDLVTSHNLLDAIRPSIMPMNGQRADLAVHKALTLLKQGALGQGRILLLTSSLSEQERQGIREALRGQSPPLLILGIGTAEGAPVTQENGSLLKDDQARFWCHVWTAPASTTSPIRSAAATVRHAAMKKTCAASGCWPALSTCAATGIWCNSIPGPLRVTGCCCRCY